jgi:hypothetical protein
MGHAFTRSRDGNSTRARPFRRRQGRPPGLLSSLALLALTTAIAKSVGADESPAQHAAAPAEAVEVDQAPPSAIPVPRDGDRLRFAAHLETGFSYRRIYGLSLGTANVDVDVGADRERVAAFVGLGFSGGAGSGLTAYQGRLESECVAKLGRLRVGGAARMGVLWLDSPTIAPSMAPPVAATMGLAVLTSVDVVRLDERGKSALYAALRFGADATFALFTASAILWGPSLSVGVRY